jgi:hypothetical protein
MAQYLYSGGMRCVKYYLVLFVGLAIFAGCSKSGVGPATKTTKPIDTDALIHSIKFVAPNQYSAVSVSGTKLTIIYYENVTLLIPAEGATLSYAIHLEQYFTNSGLANFDYTTVDAYGDVDHDWVDDNLNNVTAKTVTDTTVAGVKTTKITVQRPFIFSRTYTTSQAATMGEDSILSRQTDKIDFASYVYFTKTYPADSTTAQLYYVKSSN